MQILPVVLDSLPFRCALQLAVLGSGRGILNLEKWLEDSILTKRDSFVMVFTPFSVLCLCPLYGINYCSLFSIG